MLYYTKNPEVLQPALMEDVFGCRAPLSAKEQRETFGEMLSETLGEYCDYDTVINIHENINEIVEEAKEQPDAPVLSKTQVKELLRQSGADEEVLEHFEERYDQTAGEETEFVATNLASLKALEVKTPDVVVKIHPEKTDLMETRIIDGRAYLMIQIDDQIEVNGVVVKAPGVGKEDGISESDSRGL